MARPMVIYYAPASTVALYPTSVAGGGATSSIELAVPYPVQLSNLARYITFTSTDNLSAVNFTITGQDIFGNVISEVRAGPNNNTVSSGKLYTSISNISASGNYTNFSIGYSTYAVSRWLKINSLSTYFQYSLSSTIYGTINYSINKTLDEISYYKSVGATSQFIYPVPVLLANNPLATANGSPVVTVTVPSTATLKTGDIVTIQNAIDTGGITAVQLNINAEITVTSGTTFTYVAGGNGNGGNGGGINVSYYFPAFPTSYPIDNSLTGATTSQYFSSSNPASAFQLIVNSATAPATLTLTILQQGIK